MRIIRIEGASPLPPEARASESPPEALLDGVLETLPPEPPLPVEVKPPEVPLFEQLQAPEPQRLEVAQSREIPAAPLLAPPVEVSLPLAPARLPESLQLAEPLQQPEPLPSPELQFPEPQFPEPLRSLEITEPLAFRAEEPVVTEPIHVEMVDHFADETPAPSPGGEPPEDASALPFDLPLRPSTSDLEDLSAEALVEDSAPRHEPPENPVVSSRRTPPPRKRRSMTPAPSAKAVEKALHPPRSTGAAKKRNRVWWENVFSEDFARAILPLADDQVRYEVDFIERSLGVAKDGWILDLACGNGQHAVEYTSRGYNVVGYDLSPTLLAEAGEQARGRGVDLRLLQGDMRELEFEAEFDGIYCWNTSFGYFEEEKNVAVAKHMFRALKSGGHLLLDVINRDFAVAQQPSQNWFEGDACVCMDDMSVDFITSRLRVKRTIMLDDGRTAECSYSIRVYGLHELGKLLHDIGFKVIQASGQPEIPGVFLGAQSPRVMILALKP